MVLDLDPLPVALGLALVAPVACVGVAGAPTAPEVTPPVDVTLAAVPIDAVEAILDAFDDWVGDR